MLFRVTEEGSEPREYELPGPSVVAGRSKECEIVLAQRTVSGRHLRIMDGVIVEDLGSRNGTFLDDRTIDGPELMIGRHLTVGGPASTIEVLHPEGTPLALIEAELRQLRGQLGTKVLELRDGQRAASARREPSGAESALLRELVEHDAANQAVRLGGSVTEFYMLESFRLLRNVETVVTRLAGELTNRLGLHTALPDGEAGQNMRALLADALAHPDSRELRESLSAYNSRLLQWLYLSFDAYKTASHEFVKEVRDALRPNALLRQGKVPDLYQWTRLHELILWRRAQEYLDELSPNSVLDRLDALARECAKKQPGKGHSGRS